MHTGQGDDEIISKVLRGDQQAFAELVTRYQNFVYTIALRFTRKPEDAEEIAQDVFVKAYRSLADFMHDAKFSTWLYVIVSNTCNSFLRKKKIEIHSLHDEKIFEIADNYSKANINTTEQKSKEAIMKRAIALLSFEDAEVITLFYNGEQSIEETGKIMGLTPNATKVKLHRARKRLKEKLEMYFADEMKELIN